MALSFRALSRSFKHRNYRLFFLGQIVSLIGTWITSIATSWLVYRLTHSAVLLGTISFISLLPTLLLSPYAGVKVDRWSRHKTLLVTQTASMIQSFVLAILALTDSITVNHIFILVGIQGIVNAFDMPARQAFVSEIVESAEDLSNAIALNSGMFNAARLVGPAIGGAIIAATSEGFCFLIDGFSYMAVIYALTRMNIKERAVSHEKHNVFSEFVDGINYSINFKPIGILLVLIAVVSFAATPYMVLLPIFAAEVLSGGPDTLGTLMGASGCGAVVGAVYLASRTSVLGLARVILTSGILLGIALTVLAASSQLSLALVALFIIGLSMIGLAASSNTMIQTLVDPKRRGRVMSLFGTAFLGTMPIASLVSGWSAHALGVRFTIGVGGVISLFAIWRFWKVLPGFRAAIRPIYVERGILQG